MTTPMLPTDDPRHPAFLDSPVQDALVNICIELAAELWVTRSRLRRLEQLVRVDGVAATELIESEEDPSEQSKRAEERDLFARRIFGGIAAL
ncbi:MAG: hypothetical protein EPN43_08945 [Jatrophihabitans sp.]|nr:MAG: hypothetical protein EPN43_08945 [Jatrophihabitans sp.]